MMRDFLEEVPETTEELVGLLRRVPERVLGEQARARIAAVMSFDDRMVGELMVPREKMVFVNEKDLMGPLMLDKLYRSGFTNFPVVDAMERVRGVIHTEALNALEVKKTDRAEELMDTEMKHLHVRDSLAFAVEEIGRTNSYYFLVLDERERLAGFFTVQMLLDYLLAI